MIPAWHDLKPLRRDGRLDAVARAYSEEMAATGLLAHVSSTSGAIQDRLAAAGYPSRFAAENLAQGTSLGDVHDGLLQSPGHRAAMLSTEATRFGIGAAPRDDPAAPGTWFITQVFARPAESPARLELRVSLEARLRAQRARRGLSTPVDPRLIDVASRVAEELSDGRWLDEAMKDRVSTELRALGLGGRGWRSAYGQAWDVDGIQLPPKVEEGPWRALGVGVAVSSSAPGPRPATYVVLVVE